MADDHCKCVVLPHTSPLASASSTSKCIHAGSCAMEMGVALVEVRYARYMTPHDKSIDSVFAY